MSTSIRPLDRGPEDDPDAGSEPPTPDLLNKRQKAIEVSGWGEPFYFVQPRNACFWVYVALVAVGVVKLASAYGPLSNYYAPAFSAAAAVAVVSTLAWGWWFHHLDRFERQPLSVVAACFFWGGVAAPSTIAVAGNEGLGSLYSKLVGAVWSADWHAGLSAPFVEESAKAAGFILIIGLAPRLVRTPADGLFLGAFLGLGFQTFEDFYYAASIAAGGFGSDQVGNVTSGVFTRALTDVVSHPMFTALVCAGLVYLLGTPAQPRMLGRGLFLIAAGVGSHLVLDSMGALSASTPIPEPVVVYIEFIGSLLVLWYAFRVTDHRDRELARDILAPEVSTGVLGADELQGMTGRRERRTYVKAGRRRERRRRKHVLAASLDLCHALARSGGGDSPEVTASRAEVTRLRAALAR